MEVDHDDYMCDNSNWGFELCRKIESDNFKLLFDIYHMQISEGDIIRTINDNHDFIGHYHTAGVPGRNEIDQTQELSCNYEGYISNWIQRICGTGVYSKRTLSASIS